MQQNSDKFTPVVDEFNAIQAMVQTQTKTALNALAGNYNVLLNAVRQLENEFSELAKEVENLRGERAALVAEVERLNSMLNLDIEGNR